MREGFIGVQVSERVRARITQVDVFKVAAAIILPWLRRKIHTIQNWLNKYIKTSMWKTKPDYYC